jgi:cyclopropane fatty-acyl-phospholipid synthase-like methyltransferase
MVVLASKPRSIHPRPKTATIVRCYSLFDRFFPACGLLDYTEGIYHGDSSTPYDVAQKNQINFVLNEVGCTAGTRLLEIGCGNGTLLDAARERRAQAIGITIVPEQVRLCKSRGLDVRLVNYLDLDDSFMEQFDAVVANGPVEHFVQATDAAAGHADAIYRHFFDTCHRAIDPNSPIRRMITTTIHFARTPNPRNLLKNPFAFRWGSDDFHWAMLNHSFGGWYPVRGQFDRCAAGLFHDIHQTDGTYDYHLTSEEWLRRIQVTLPTTKGLQLLINSVPYALRHPIQYLSMFACMLASQSWNWQFRGPNPPTRLIRQTWAYES